jgi:hypothetical protein
LLAAAAAASHVRAKTPRPLRGGTLEPLAVDVDVGPLVEEADEVPDLRIVGRGVGVAPGDVFINLAAYRDRPVVRLPLVGALLVQVSLGESRSIRTSSGGT